MNYIPKILTSAGYFRADLERLMAKYGFKEPDRGNLDDPNINWREGKPDYTKVNDLAWTVTVAAVPPCRISGL